MYEPTLDPPLEWVDVRVTIEEGVVVDARVDVAPADEPHPGVHEAIVRFRGWTHRYWPRLFERADLVYWSSVDVEMPDGTRLKPDDPSVIPGLMAVADDRFESTLPPGTAMFSWTRGVKTWRELRVSRDVMHGCAELLPWAFFGLFGCAVVAWGAIGGRELVARRRIRAGRCWRCAYDMSGACRCPECGEDRPRLPLEESRARGSS